jgi:4-hydroxybenzoate polyprenyltransferase
MRFLELIRWKNILILLFSQVFAYVFLKKEYCSVREFDINILFICLSTALIAAGGYLINDYFDVKIDAVNKPEKLIVGRFISRRLVLLLHLVFSFTGVILGALADPKLGLINLFVAFMLWQYTVRLKYRFLIGNLCVALLMGLSIIIVAYASDCADLLWLAFYAFFAFLMGLIREIIKDIEDMEGDAQYECRTLPNVLGIFRTKIVLNYLLLASLSLLLLSCVYLINQTYIELALYLILTTVIPLIVFFFRLFKADAKKDFSVLSTWAKLIMMAGVLSMTLRYLY